MSRSSGSRRVESRLLEGGDVQLNLELFTEVLEDIRNEFRALVADNHFGYAIGGDISFERFKDCYTTSTG